MQNCTEVGIIKHLCCVVHVLYFNSSQGLIYSGRAGGTTLLCNNNLRVHTDTIKKQILVVNACIYKYHPIKDL